MKSFGLFLSTLVATSLVHAQFEPKIGSVATSPLHLVSEVLPSFPRELVLAGVNRGSVRLAVGVTPAGAVDDCIALAYTDKAFADAAIACVREWKCDPLRVDGKPIAASCVVTIDFRRGGAAVISLSGGAGIESFALLMARFYHSKDFRTRDLRELDAIPRPIFAPAPLYPRDLLKRGRTGTVTVAFYIDPTGAVHLPSVDAVGDPALSALAIAALQTWRFEPPRCNHQPVQVAASQVFRFGASN